MAEAFGLRMGLAQFVRVGLLDRLQFVRQAFQLVRCLRHLQALLLLRFSLVLTKCLLQQSLVLSDSEQVIRWAVVGCVLS